MNTFAVVTRLLLLGVLCIGGTAVAQELREALVLVA